MNEILFLAVFFLCTFLLGRLLEIARIPWIFSSLLLGVFLGIYNPWPDLTVNSAIELLSSMGMYFLLFIIGFELEIKKLFKSSGLIVRTTATVILLETLFGALFLHLAFSMSIFMSIVVAASFATVGEAVLLPILDEFKMTKTKFGQTILSIGVLDDIVEVLVIIIVSVLLGRDIGYSRFNIFTNFLLLLSLFGLAFLIIKLKKYITHFKYKEIPSFFLFVIFMIFLFVGIGLYVESAALGALLAGVALRNIIPKKILEPIDSEIRTVSYGLFAPLFFMTVGLSVSLDYLMEYPLLIVLALLIMTSAKILGSYIMTRKELGTKGSVLMGIGLSVKLSTSIVILKLLLDSGLLNPEVYSVLIGATIMFLILIPVVFAETLAVWKLKL